MKRSHLMSASAGVAVAMAVGMGSITPAHAVDYTVTENCSASANLDIQLTVGDTYSIVNNGCTLAAAFNGTGPLPRGVGEVTINSTPMVIGGGAQLFANPGTLVYSATTAGRGGAVCTRTLTFANSAWKVIAA